MPQKCPGKWFREGITLIEVVRLFPDDGAAGNWFARRLNSEVQRY